MSSASGMSASTVCTFSSGPGVIVGEIKEREEATRTYEKAAVKAVKPRSWRQHLPTSSRRPWLRSAE